MAGQEQEGSLAQGEPRGSANRVLLRQIRRSGGQPEVNLERHRLLIHGGGLRGVRRAGSIFP